MSSASRAPLLLVGLAVVVAGAVAAAWLLLDDGGGPVLDGAGAAAPLESGDARRGAEPPAPVEGWQGRVGTTAGSSADALSGATRELAGQLLRLADGSPLAGVEILEPAPGLTDAEGRFDLGVQSAEVARLVLWIKPRGRGGQRGPDTNPDLGARRLAVPLPESGNGAEPLVLRVDSGWMVRGRVQSRDGLPVAGARVLATRGVATDRADGAGRFELRDLEVGEDVGRVSLRALAPMHASAESWHSLPSRGRLLEGVVLSCDPAGALAGRVVGPDGAPRERARVQLAWALHPASVGDVDPNTWALSDAAGDYRLDGVPAGAWVVVTRADGLAPKYVTDVVTEVGRVTTLDLFLEQPTRVSGIVVDAQGLPVEDAEVTVDTTLSVRTPARVDALQDVLAGARAHAVPGVTPPGRTDLAVRLVRRPTDAAGRFDLEGLPPGALSLGARSASHPGWRPVVQPLEPGAGQRLGGLRLVLGGGLTVRGVVLGPDAEPLPGTSVALTPGEGTAAVDRDDQLSVAADGSFAFEGLEDVPHQLFVEAPGSRSHTQVVRPGAAPLRLILEPAPLLVGRVVDALSGQPVTRFELRLEDETSWSVRGWDSADGRFRYDTLADSPYTLSVRAAGYQPIVLPDVRPSFGVAEELLIQLSPGG